MKTDRAVFSPLKPDALGKGDCFTSLCKIVNEANSARLSRRASQSLHEFNAAMHQIETIAEPGFRVHLATLLYNNKRRAQKESGNLAFDTHLRCCLSAIYKRHIRKWRPNIFKTTKHNNYPL